MAWVSTRGRPSRRAAVSRSSRGLRVCRQGETSSYGAAADHSRFTPRPRQVARRHSRVRVVFVVDNDVVEVRDQLRARAGERKDLEVAGQRADGTVQSAPHPVGVVPAAGEAPISGMLPWGPVPRVGCVTDPVDVGAVTLDGVDWPLRGVQWCGVGLAHPTAANWRAAARTWGPMSARSPSRSNSAGARSSRMGLRP
jgi:hypothetical protein